MRLLEPRSAMSSAAVRAALLGIASVCAFAASTRALDVDRWHGRLEALGPERAVEYLLLAEEVVSLGTTREEDRLAAELFALSGSLSPSTLGRSAALGVAAVADPSTAHGARERRAALALARVRGGLKGSAIAPAQAIAIVEAATVAADIRAGRMGDARRRLRDPAVEAAFSAIAASVQGGAERLRMDMAGQREGVRPPQRVEDVEAVLAATVAALDRGDARWSVALTRTDGAPLTWVDEQGLAELLGVTPDRPIWRGGAWVAAPAR